MSDRGTNNLSDHLSRMDQAKIHSHLIRGRLNIAVHERHLLAQPAGAGVNASEREIQDVISARGHRAKG